MPAFAVRLALLAPFALLAPAASLVYACESAPANRCTPYSASIASAGAHASTCNGICTSVVASVGEGDAGIALDLCTPDCTTRGDAVCTAGTKCVSEEPLRAGAYCLIVCGDGGATCPSPLTCVSAAPIADASYCLLGCDAAQGATACPSPLTCGDAGFCQ